MIETVLLNYLNTAELSATVYMEQPKVKPEAFFVLEKTGGTQTNHRGKNVGEVDHLITDLPREF